MSVCENKTVVQQQLQQQAAAAVAAAAAAAVAQQQQQQQPTQVVPQPQHMTPQQQQQSTQSIADYLAQLLKDRKQLAAFPNVFTHVERLLDEGMLYIQTENKYI